LIGKTLGIWYLKFKNQFHNMKNITISRYLLKIQYNITIIMAISKHIQKEYFK